MNSANQCNLINLKFIGGPFDGFYESISSEVQLPVRVALPVNGKAGRIFGVKVENANSSRIAIYRLHCRDGLSSYHFERMSSLEAIANSANQQVRDNVSH